MSVNRTVWLKNGIIRDEPRFSERTMDERLGSLCKNKKKITKGTVRKRTNWMEN